MPMPAEPPPQEILDDIVDWVAIVAPGSLKDIALASRAILERSRRHLFLNVYLSEPLWLPTITWKILHRNPSLFGYGRRMVVNRKLPAFPVPNSVFRAALSHIANLQVVDIDVGMDHNVWHFDYKIFNDICPNITHLSIDFYQDMALDVFLPLTQLRELRMTYNQWHPTAAQPYRWKITFPEFTIRTPPWKLTSFHYHPRGVQVKEPMRLLLSPRYEPHFYGALKHLSLAFDYFEHHCFALSTILPACQHSPLETLHLSYGADCKSPLGHMNVVPEALVHTNSYTMPRLASLRYLSISLRTFRTESSTAMPRHQADLVSVLIDHTPQPSLEAVDLLFTWDTRLLTQTQLASSSLVARDLGWDDIDSSLASKALFPQLQAARVITQLEDEPRSSIFAWYRSTDQSELGRALREQTCAALPQAIGRGLLLDVGLDSTRRRFDDIAKPILDGAWTYVSESRSSS